MCQTTDEGSTNSSLNSVKIPYLHEELSNCSVFCFSVTAIFGSSMISVEGNYALDSQDDTNSGANSVPLTKVCSTSMPGNSEDHGTLIAIVVASSLCAVMVVFILIIIPLAVAVVWRRKTWAKSRSKHSDNTYQ